MLALLAILLAAPSTHAMLPVKCGDPAQQATCTSLGTAIAAELRRYPGIVLVTQEDVQAVLKHEQNRQLLGCSEPDCLGNVGEALGVKKLVSASYSVLGKSQLVSVTMLGLAPTRVIGAVSKRVQDTEIDHVLDALPGLMADLMEQANGAAEPLKKGDKDAPTKLPTAGAELPLDTSAKVPLVLLTDGAGAYFAHPVEETRSLLLAGDKSALYAQLLIGSGANGADFDVTFWDPNYGAGADRGLMFKDGVYTLICGKKNITLTKVEPEAAKKILAGARLLRPRWQRRAFALARDDAGTYYYVDTVRDDENKKGDESDYHLFIGRKGNVEFVPLEDAIIDGSGASFITAKGRLVFTEGMKSAAWAVGQGQSPLKAVDLFSEAAMIYSKLGAYKGQALGTPCDRYR
ncbi:MAG: hypothetical protein JST92_09950 [Deltaproteobacteria bacterium]|nr:hypothetical protein [Deltaproteobacteria bacterium]